MKQPIDEKCVFALLPDGTGDGVPLMVVGIPEKAWLNLRQGKTSTFDLTKVGLPVKFSLFGAESHDAAMKVLEQAASEKGVPFLDERRRDFSVEAFNESATDRAKKKE